MFLQEFVGDGIPWAHLDIAGPADSSEVDGELVKGGTGFGVRTLVELLTGYTKPKRLSPLPAVPVAHQRCAGRPAVRVHHCATPLELLLRSR